MNFRTEIKLQKERDQVDYNAQLFLIGSCFSENIYKKLDHFKFDVFHNPFGILFHPKAIEKLILNIYHKNKYSLKDIFQLNERWHCFDAHSNLSSSNKEELVNRLNLAIDSSYQKLSKASHVFITLGTAWIYRHNESRDIVGNCHKVPQNKFSKEILSVDEIVSSLDNIVNHLNKFKPNINIIFTVSPVRHIKDGFSENARSKAHLLAAIHAVVSSNLPKRNNFYFPAYEIMLDDLRDYRFYKSDMLHPNTTAIDYIWNQFHHVWINEHATSIMKEVDAVQKGLAHKPFNIQTEQHQQFLANLKTKIQTLKTQHNISF